MQSVYEDTLVADSSWCNLNYNIEWLEIKINCNVEISVYIHYHPPIVFGNLQYVLDSALFKMICFVCPGKNRKSPYKGILIQNDE